MRRYLGALLALFAGAAFAQQAPVGLPQPEKSPRDTEFGVVSRRFGLERRVEMYQWRAAGQGYEKVWSATPIASAAFAPGHDNPETFPLASRRILAATVTLDDRPLDPEVVARFGEWREFRPNFSALPGNLSATFQPEGDGLGSAENPLDPQIGDLRIQWRELHLPPLDDKVELRDGRWQLTPDAAERALDVARDPVVVELPGDQDRKLLPWLLAGAVALAMAALAWRRARRRR